MATNHSKIETLKIFPYIAWGTLIIFAFFVYKLAVELSQISENLKEATVNLRQQEQNLTPPVTTQNRS